MIFSSLLIIGIFDEEEKHSNLTICPRHRNAFGLRWRSNRKTCSCPNSWAAHRKANVKGERGITLEQSRRLYKATAVITPIGSSEFIEVLVGIFAIVILTTPFLPSTKCPLGSSRVPLHVEKKRVRDEPKGRLRRRLRS